MAQSFASEINWWKSRAAEFDSKRARVQPLSYSYASQAYATRGNYNGAASLDSMRLDIYRKADQESATLKRRIEMGTYTKPLTAAEKKKASAVKPSAPNTLIKPSESVANLDSQVDKLQRKIKGVGGDVTRTLVGGFSRALDVLSRFGYAAQTIRADAITDAKASGGNISVGEHLQIAAKPFLMMTPASGFIASAAILGNDSAKDFYSDGWAGLSGKKKTVGIDNLRAEFPNWAKEHNTSAAILGFASDIASDPTTYLTMGSGTVVKTGGMVGAKVLGQKALAKSLADQTIWTKAGRTAGTATLKQSIRTEKTAKAIKTSTKAGKQSAKAGRKFDKAATSGKAAPEELTELATKFNKSEVYRIKAQQEWEVAHTAAFADDLRGFSDVGRFLIKHPFKTVGSYGQGMRTGSAAVGNKTAKAIHDGVVDDFVKNLTDVDALKNSPMAPLSMTMRTFWLKNAGTTIKLRNSTFVVDADYTKFVRDAAKNIIKFKPVTEMTRRAARNRYSVLSQAKAESNEFINALITQGDTSFGILTRYTDDVRGSGSPLAKVAAVPTEVDSLDDSPAMPSIRRAADESLDADVARALDAIMGSQTLRESMMMDLFDARPAEAVAMDVANGISDQHIMAREYFKTVARTHMDNAGIQLDDAGRIAPEDTRFKGEFATTGQQTSQYNAKRDRAIAEAISESMEQAVRNIAMHELMNDPDIIVKGYIDAAHDMLNRVSADTHVQVMEFLRYKHGKSMPSMNMPRNHVDTLFETGDIYKGLGAQADKHHAAYLRQKIVDAIGEGSHEISDNDYWQMIDAVAEYAGQSAKNELLGTGNINNGTIENFVPGLMERLRTASQELERLHYTPEGVKTSGAVDKYTMLDHLVYGRGPTEELKIGVGGSDPKIGRAAFASDSLNTNGIPPYSSELMADLKTLDEMEENAIKGYAKWATEGVPKGSNIPIKTEEEIRELFKSIKRGLANADLNYVYGENGKAAQRMMHSLGSHLDLLHNNVTTGIANKNFGIEWRRQVASNLWGIPKAKRAAKDGSMVWEEGPWSSASLMADLNDAISLGILEKTVKGRMNPEAVADWLADTTRDNPILEMIMKDANLQGVRGGKVGAPFNASNPVDVSSTDAFIAKGGDPQPFAAMEAEEARDLAAWEAARDPLSPVTAEDVLPGGFSAPQIEKENIKIIQDFIDKTYDNVDVVTLGRLMEDMRLSQITQIFKYDQKMQESLSNMQLQQSLQVRVMGMPMVSLPLTNNPMHTNAGVLALNQDLPRHLASRSKLDSANIARTTQHRWFTRPTSSLDEGMRQIATRFSSESTLMLRETMDHVKKSYHKFKNRAELHTATRDYFTLGMDIDPRLAETQLRFNDVHNHILEHARRFTEKDLGYDSNFVKGSVSALMNALPDVFKVPSEVMRKFDSVEAPFSREWFIDLSGHLNRQGGKFATHALAGDNLKKLDMSRFEFNFQHTASKLRVRNETNELMLETFTSPMRADIVAAHNALPGIFNTKFELVETEEFFAGNVVSEALKGRYVDRGVAEEMRKVMNFVDEMMDNRRQKINFGYMRDINNMWKAGVTIFSGKYHVANVMSDGFMSMLDGVRPLSYKKSANTLFSDAETIAKYSDPAYMAELNATFAASNILPEDVSVITSTIEYIKAHGHSAPISHVTINGKSLRVTSAEYQMRYRQYGLDQNNVTGNLSKGTENMTSPGLRQASQFSDVVQEQSAKREDYFRMAHFIHSFEQEAKVPGRTLDDAWLAARDRVITWHFDYDNVTEFERNFVAPVAPFYKWTRNIVPLSFSVFFTNPKAYNIGTAANRAMGQIMFPTQEDAEGNIVPLDVVIPRWIPEQGAVPMEVYTDIEGNQQMRYAVLNLPFDQAMVKWFSPFTESAVDPETNMVDKVIRQPGQSLAGNAMAMTHPVVQTVATAAFGSIPISGGSIPEEDWWNPMLNMLYSGTGALGEVVKNSQNAKKDDSGYSPTQFFGDAGVTRVRSVTEGAKKGELLRQEDRLTSILKTKAGPEWMAKNHPGVDPNSEEGKKILHDHFVSIGVLQK